MMKIIISIYNLYIISILFLSYHFIDGRNIFNQTAGYQIQVNLDTWSNFGTNGGCVSCPYTCIRNSLGPDGLAINFTNSSIVSALPPAYTKIKQNGCCFAPKSKTTQSPNCDQAAEPADAEDCGFLYGPSLEWDITSNNPPKDPISAILFASVDCLSFWAVGMEYVKQDPKGSSGLIEGNEVINGGCYGNPAGEAIVLAGCLSNLLKFDKDKTYTWEMLAEKCQGLSGQCSRTNGLYGRNLKCCTDLGAITGSTWDLNYKEYTKEPSRGIKLTGPGIVGVVIAGVVFMMLLVHYGRKVKKRAAATALLREQEASDEYDQLITPLNASADQQVKKSINSNMTLDVSLHENDEIFNVKQDEVLYEGDL